MSLINERKYGIDILRILSMLAIVGLHLLNAGGAVNDAAGVTLNQAVLRFFLIICYYSVDVFAMMSGYLYAGRKQVKCKNIVNIVVTCAFYCIISTVMFMLFYREVFADKMMIAYSLFPPLAGKYWYLVSYFFMFLLIPSLNKFISSINKKQYKSVLALLFITLSVISTVGMEDYFKIDSGYSPFWLMFCYLVGGYIRLYSSEEKTKKRKIIYLAVFFVNILIAWGLWIFTEKVFGKPLGFETMTGYVSPLTVCNAAMLIMIFSDISVKNKFLRKAVIGLSGGAFDVYIIHCHILVLSVLIEGRLSFIPSMHFIPALGIFLGAARLFILFHTLSILSAICFSSCCASTSLYPSLEKSLIQSFL